MLNCITPINRWHKNGYVVNRISANVFQEIIIILYDYIAFLERKLKIDSTNTHNINKAVIFPYGDGHQMYEFLLFL